MVIDLGICQTFSYTGMKSACYFKEDNCSVVNYKIQAFRTKSRILKDLRLHCKLKSFKIQGPCATCSRGATDGVAAPGLLPQSQTVSTDPPTCLQSGWPWLCGRSPARGTLGTTGAKLAQAPASSLREAASFLDACHQLRTFESQAVQRCLSLTSTPAPPPP